jgi:hypothetical protein
MSFQRRPLRLEDVMTEHVTYGSGALALERTEEVVELQRTGEECRERFALVGRRRELPNGRSKESKAVQLPSVEEVQPISVTPAKRLPGVIPVFQLASGKHEQVTLLVQEFVGFLIEIKVELIN